MVVSKGNRSPVVVTPVVIARVVAVFEESGSVGAAARAVGCAHSTARRVLVEAGLFPAEPQPLGKPRQRAEFEALIAAGMHHARALVRSGLRSTRAGTG